MYHYLSPLIVTFFQFSDPHLSDCFLKLVFILPIITNKYLFIYIMQAPKIIDKKYAIEIYKHSLGNGTYGKVYPAYKLGDPQTKLACKIL